MVPFFYLILRGWAYEQVCVCNIVATNESHSLVEKIRQQERVRTTEETFGLLDTKYFPRCQVEMNETILLLGEVISIWYGYRSERGDTTPAY